MNDKQPPGDMNVYWWDSAKLAWAAQVDYGRWIVNTLWLMHSGAIAGLLYKWSGQGDLPHKWAIGFLVAGILFAFGTAGAAWLNFTVAEDWFRRWTYARELWPVTEIEEHSVWLKRTKCVAIGCVGLSLLCLLAGAAIILFS